MKTVLILTCEHYTNAVPVTFKSCFTGNEAVLNTHRGYDIGAAEVFEELKSLATFHYKADCSRLLIELNRSLHHSNLFSEFTTNCSDAEKEILIKYYTEYRSIVTERIANEFSKGFRVLHIGVHSFTPIWRGEKRNADLGILYNPKHHSEKSFAIECKKGLKKLDSNATIRFNYPYLGKADGFTTTLRDTFSGKDYMGIELEFNQDCFKKNHKPIIISQIKQVLNGILR